MPEIELLPTSKPVHKANLHSHTTFSDGALTPEQLKAAYKAAGYTIIAITDHDKYFYHRQLNEPDFLCLAGVEISINTSQDGPQRLSNRQGTYHFNFYDIYPENRTAEFTLPLPPAGCYGDDRAINRWLGSLAGQGFLCCYNHPYWSLQDWRNYASLKHLFAMEIYNHGCELDGLYGYAPQAYDEMLAAGQSLYPLATDDNHNVYPIGHPLCDSFGGFTMLYADSLRYASVVTALKNGDFYASTGPTFTGLFIENGSLVVLCSEVEKIYLKTAGRRCLCEVAQEGKSLTAARFALEGVEQPFRVNICDHYGRHAYTRTYQL